MHDTRSYHSAGTDEPLELTTLPWLNGRKDGGFTKVMALFLDGRTIENYYPYGTSTWCDRKRGYRTDAGRLTYLSDGKTGSLANLVLSGNVPIGFEEMCETDPRRLAISRIQVGIVGSITSAVLPWDIDTFDSGILASGVAQTVVREVFGLEGELAERTVRSHLQLLMGSSRRGKSRGHIFFDWRGWNRPETWPSQTGYLGTDIKANGFVAAPGCLHHSGETYEPHTGELPPRSHCVPLGGDEDVMVLVITPTPAIVKAFCQASPPRAEVQAAGYVRKERVSSGSDPESVLADADDQGHDNYLKSFAYGCVFNGWDTSDIYNEWCERAEIIQDPANPFREGDFRRHLSGALRKHERHLAAEQARLKEEQEAQERAHQQMLDRLARARERAREVREEARRSFIRDLGNPASRETPTTCIPQVSYEDGPQLTSGHGEIVTEAWKIARIHKYEAELWSADWTQQAAERLLALDLLARLKARPEGVPETENWLVKRRETLESLLKNHASLFGRTVDGLIVVLEDGGGEDDCSWSCRKKGCGLVHRLKDWPNLPPQIVLAQSCPLDTGIDVRHDRRGQERLVEVYMRLRRELEAKAKAQGRPLNPTKDRVTGKMLASAWNAGERGEFACLSIGKANEMKRDLADKKELLIRLRKSRNYLRKHRCRTASAVYGLPSERPELVSPDPTVRKEAERKLKAEDDMEWLRFWMRREQSLTEVQGQRLAVAA